MTKMIERNLNHDHLERLGVYTDLVDEWQLSPDFIVSHNELNFKGTVVIERGNFCCLVFSRYKDYNGNVRKKGSKGKTLEDALNGLDFWVKRAVLDEIEKRSSLELPENDALKDLGSVGRDLVLIARIKKEKSRKQ